MSTAEWRAGARPVAALLLLLGAGGACAQASPGPADAPDPLVAQELARVSAARTLRWSATLLVSQGNALSLHKVTPDGVTAVDGDGQALATAAGELTLRIDGLPALAQPRRPALALDTDQAAIARLQRGYRIEVLPLDRVDGRPALPLKLTPLDRWRYGSTLWIDRDTGLVSKTELRQPDGQRLAQTMLTALVFESGAVALPAVADGAAVTPQWLVQGMPEGFGMTQVIRDGAAEQILVSDGLAAVSVFIEPLAAGVAGQNGTSQRGLLASVAQVRGDFQLVVIGVVPPHTVERLLNGVTRR